VEISVGPEGHIMSRKEFYLVGFVVPLGVLYAIFFSGWFAPKFIRVEHTVRASREAWAGNGQRAQVTAPQGGNVTFSFDQRYRLTSIRVLSVAEAKTNRHAHPLWHLVSKEGSQPADGFAYGFPVPGMAPAVKGAEPDALKPGVEYRLIVEAGSRSGTNDFRLDRAMTAR
jgi:hypothetical protein